MKSKPKMPPASLRDFASAPEQGPPPAMPQVPPQAPPQTMPKPPTVKRPPGGMGRTKVMKTGTMKKKAF
jgi:hypothetical protein